LAWVNTDPQIYDFKIKEMLSLLFSSFRPPIDLVQDFSKLFMADSYRTHRALSEYVYIYIYILGKTLADLGISEI